MLTAKSSNGNLLQIRHLVLGGYSQWVIGLNVTYRANIMKIDGNCIIAPGTEHSHNRPELVEQKYHLHLTLEILLKKLTTDGTYFRIDVNQMA